MSFKKSIDSRFETDEQGRVIYYRYNKRKGYILDTPERERKIRNSLVLVPVIPFVIIILGVISRSAYFIGFMAAIALPAALLYDHMLVRGLKRTDRPRSGTSPTYIQKVNSLHPKPVILVMSLIGWAMAGLGLLGLVLGMQDEISSMASVGGLGLCIVLMLGGIAIGFAMWKAFRLKSISE